VSDPRLYMRQVQVLGEEAQRALVTLRLRAPRDATTRDYLERSGMVFSADGGTTCDAGVSAAELVADARLIDAAEALLGAFAAVETMKAATGLGRPGRWPSGLRLDGQDA